MRRSILLFLATQSHQHQRYLQSPDSMTYRLLLRPLVYLELRNQDSIKSSQILAVTTVRIYHIRDPDQYFHFYFRIPFTYDAADPRDLRFIVIRNKLTYTEYLNSLSFPSQCSFSLIPTSLPQEHRQVPDPEFSLFRRRRDNLHIFRQIHPIGHLNRTSIPI